MEGCLVSVNTADLRDKHLRKMQKEQKETKATRLFTPPHISRCENLYTQHEGTPRGQPVPSTHQDVPAERTWGRSSGFPAGRPWIFFFVFQKIKNTFFFVTQASSGLWQKNLYELIYFRPFVHLKKLSLKSHSEINIFFSNYLHKMIETFISYTDKVKKSPWDLSLHSKPWTGSGYAKPQECFPALSRSSFFFSHINDNPFDSKWAKKYKTDAHIGHPTTLSHVVANPDLSQVPSNADIAE